jgi:hypothetical protein
MSRSPAGKAAEAAEAVLTWLAAQPAFETVQTAEARHRADTSSSL